MRFRDHRASQRARVKSSIPMAQSIVPHKENSHRHVYHFPAHHPVKPCAAAAVLAATQNTSSECPPERTRLYSRNNLKLAKSIFNLDVVWNCGIFHGESELSPEAGELDQQPWLLHFEKTEWLGVVRRRNDVGLPAAALSQDPG